MQVANYDKQEIVEFIKDNSKNDPKKKGVKPKTPNDDKVSSDIKAMSITNDVDGAVFNVSFHQYPARFYSFVIPEEMYDLFEHFKYSYNYTRTPRKATVSMDKFDGLFKPKKGIKDMLKEVNKE